MKKYREISTLNDRTKVFRKNMSVNKLKTQKKNIIPTIIANTDQRRPKKRHQQPTIHSKITAIPYTAHAKFQPPCKNPPN